MTRASDSSLVDANILVYAASPAAPQYRASLALLESEKELCASPQVFAEFYSVVTNPRRVTDPFTPVEAVTFIGELLPRLEVLSVSAGVLRYWISLARNHGITGADVFDVQLAATMLEHGIRRIYTFNLDDFKMFSELEALTP